MTDQNPISPLNLVPEELLDKWEEDWHHAKVKHIELVPYIAAMAAQWGADQELEACCLWLNGGSKIDYDTAALLRAARRPKPSLKERALQVLEDANLDSAHYNIILRALEQLND
jgi:uncharacterized membrane protein (DUF2068 family)